MNTQFVFMDDESVTHRIVAYHRAVEELGYLTHGLAHKASPDINQIVHVWDILGRHLAGRHQSPETIPELPDSDLCRWRHARATISPISNQIFFGLQPITYIFHFCLMSRYAISYLFNKALCVSFGFLVWKFCSLFPYFYILRILSYNLCWFETFLNELNKITSLP